MRVSSCPRGLLLGVTALTALVAPRDAAAFQIGSFITADCHERVTLEALGEARQGNPTAARIDGAYEFREALIETMPVDLRGQRDLGAALLVLANRDVDLRGTSPTELSNLAQVHGEPANQSLHCLRLPEQDGAEGQQQALQDCRDTIRRLVGESLAALDDVGQPEPTQFTTLDAFLHFTAVTEVDIPQSHLALGRALHALQDSFTHMYRSEDGRTVLAVLNYSELAEDTLDEPVDGPPHAGGLDRCDDAEPYNTVRRQLATEASARLLSLVFRPDTSDEAKLQELDVLLDDYLTPQDGCTFDNGWCSAPARDLEDPAPLACTHVEPPADSAGGAAFAGLGLFGLLLLRRRRLRLHAAAGLLGAIVLLVPTDSEASDFGVQIAGSAAVENAGFAGSIGGRYRLSEGWLVGLDAEWNPWIGGTIEDVKPGAVNVYASVVKRFPMRFEKLDLRTTLELGVSRIMYDVVGVAEGSIGPYVGFNLLGIDYELGDSIYLIVDPAHISIPIPQIRGVPFAYVQYQIRLGVQFGG